MNNLYVVISGGYRTGSTFACIVVYEIFTVNFQKFNHGVKPHPELEKYKSDIPSAFKSHDFLPGDNKWKIIHTVRNPFDILSSLKKCRPNLPNYMADVKEIITRDQYFKSNKNTLILRYEDFFGQEIKAIDAILPW